ncbi:hypothetical protein CCP3SC15_560019 [Gammaproteobacteria bacterium]
MRYWVSREGIADEDDNQKVEMGGSGMLKFVGKRDPFPG